MTVSLTSYVIAPKDTMISKIDSVLLPDGRHPPRGFFTALYGAKDTLSALLDAQKNAREQGLLLHHAGLKVKVGEDKTSRVDRDLAKTAVIVNLARLEPDFEATLIQHVANDETEKSLADIIDADPNLLEKLFNCPDLPVVNVIVWPATGNDGKGKLQVASVRDLSQITIVNTMGSFSKNPKISRNVENNLYVVPSHPHHEEAEDDDTLLPHM